MPTLKEAVQRIKQIGVENIRKVPTSNGRVDIQAKQGNGWVTILENVQASAADDIIRQASNRVMLG